MFLHIRFLKKKVKVELRVPEVIGRKKEKFKIEVEIINESCFPIPELRAEIGYRDLYTGNTGKLSGVAMLDGKRRAVLSFKLNSDYCGVMEFWLERVILSDYLGVFTKTCEKSSEVQRILILPVLKPEMEMSDVQGQIFSADGMEFELYRPGDDPSETYDIREFRSGDTLHRVHWKMTAKTDNLLVRDFSQPVESTTLILFDLKQEKELSRDEWDHFLETAASLSDRMVRFGYPHYAAWMDGKAGEVMRFYVGREEELQMMLSVLLQALVYDTGEIITCYKENYADETHSEIIRINLEGKIIRERGEE